MIQGRLQTWILLLTKILQYYAYSVRLPQTYFKVINVDVHAYKSKEIQFNVIRYPSLFLAF